MASESQERYRSIFESAVDGIIVIDKQGRIEAFNKAAERLFGYTEAEVVGRNVSLLMPSPYREEHDSWRRTEAVSTSTARRVAGRPLPSSCRARNVDR